MTRCAIPIALLALAFLLPAAGAPAPAEYRIESLGTLGGDSSEALALNEQGEIVGWALDRRGQRRAFIWADGQMRALGSLGGKWGEARDINESGRVVGVSTNRRGYRRAVCWEGPYTVDIGTLGGKQSWAHAVSDSGEIVGAAQRRRKRFGKQIVWAFRINLRLYASGNRYRRFGTMIPVPQPPMDLDEVRPLWSRALAIRDDLVVGTVYVDGFWGHAFWPFTWSHGELWVGGGDGYGFDADTWVRSINNGGVTVGSLGTSDGDVDAFIGLLQDGRIEQRRTIQLPEEVDPSQRSEARGINESGVVVGNGSDWANNRGYRWAWIYCNDRAELLSNLLPPGNGWSDLTANAINDRGQIVGQGELNGRRVAYLMTPVRSSPWSGGNR